MNKRASDIEAANVAKEKNLCVLGSALQKSLSSQQKLPWPTMFRDRQVVSATQARLIVDPTNCFFKQTKNRKLSLTILAEDTNIELTLQKVHPLLLT